MPVERITISIPNDLKNRMDRVKESVNWSQIAAHAFEMKLAEIAAKKERKTMEDVVQRLRGSKLQHSAERQSGIPSQFEREYLAGFDAGVAWASNVASWPELVTMAGQKVTIVTADVAHIAPGRNQTSKYSRIKEAAALDWWNSLTTQSPTFDALQGFIAGAAKVYKDVEGKV